MPADAEDLSESAYGWKFKARQLREHIRGRDHTVTRALRNALSAANSGTLDAESKLRLMRERLKDVLGRIEGDSVDSLYDAI